MLTREWAQWWASMVSPLICLLAYAEWLPTRDQCSCNRYAFVSGMSAAIVMISLVGAVLWVAILCQCRTCILHCAVYGVSHGKKGIIIIAIINQTFRCVSVHDWEWFGSQDRLTLSSLSVYRSEWLPISVHQIHLKDNYCLSIRDTKHHNNTKPVIRYHHSYEYNTSSSELFILAIRHSGRRLFRWLTKPEYQTNLTAMPNEWANSGNSGLHLNKGLSTKNNRFPLPSNRSVDRSYLRLSFGRQVMTLVETIDQSLNTDCWSRIPPSLTLQSLVADLETTHVWKELIWIQESLQQWVEREHNQ